MATFNIENDFVTDYVHKVNYEDGYGHSDGATKIKPYLDKIVPISASVGAYTPNDCERPRKIDVNSIIPGDTIQGTLRMIWTNRCYNMRDIGGWSCGQNKHMAYGRIIRGAEIGGLKDQSISGVKEDIETLTKTVGINVEIDLRGKSEYSVSPLGANVKLYNSKSYACTGYGDFSTNKKTKTILSTVISELDKGNTLFIHCAQGADRTGLICFVIEGLCGCSEDSLIKDWELTSFGDYIYTKYIDDENELRKFCCELYSKYGGKDGKNINEQIYSWATKSIGLTASQIETLRKNMIVEETSSGESEKHNDTEEQIILPFSISVSELKPIESGKISTGSGILETGKDCNFNYIEIDQKYFGRSIEVTYSGSLRHFSLLSKIPVHNREKVVLASGFSDVDGKWTAYAGTNANRTRVVTIPNVGKNETIYLVVQNASEKKMTITIR